MALSCIVTSSHGLPICADGSELTIRNLNEKSFAGKDFDSQAALNNVVQANLENDPMYHGRAVIATRMAAAGK
jgi:hypothetical protein